MLTDSELSRLVESLPPSPRLVAELGTRLQQAEVPLADVTGVLRRDPSLTVRLIAMANSAAYARAEPATTLEDAVACVGYRDVHRLLGALAAQQMSEQPLSYYRAESARFRENALFVALVIEELEMSAHQDSHTAYTMGLLRSIGKVVLNRAAQANPAVTPLDGTAQPMLEWERANWGCTNAEVAARILTAWRFPVEMVETVRHHYRPAEDAPAMSHLLNLCAGAADLRGFGFCGEESYWEFTQENFDRTGVDEGKLVWAGERAFQTLTRIRLALG